MSSPAQDVRNRKNGPNGDTYTCSDSHVSPSRLPSDVDGEGHRGDYIILHRPDRISTFFKSWRHWGRNEVKTSSPMDPTKERMKWRYILSQGFLDILWLFSGVLAFIGKCVELPGNIWTANGGSLWQLTKRILKWQFVIPEKEDPTYHSLISQLDPRTKLWEDKSAAGQAQSESATSTIFPGNEAGARSTADVLVMASKLAYENQAIIKKVVTEDWNVSAIQSCLKSLFCEAKVELLT